jgi:HEAT repeat protein
LQHGDVDDRSSAALRLNLDLHPKAIDALRTALGDEATEVRESAAQSLALLGDTSSLEAVVRVARLSDASWPRASLWAACALAATSSDAAWIVRAHRLIEDLTLDGPPAARQQAEYLRRELAGGSR